MVVFLTLQFKHSQPDGSLNWSEVFGLMSLLLSLLFILCMITVTIGEQFPSIISKQKPWGDPVRLTGL